MRKQGIIYFLLILALWSCREDFERNIATPQEFTPELIDDFVQTETLINASLIGFVQDDKANPIVNALITLNGTPTTTDIYGHFFYSDHPMNKEGTVVEILADNYHHHSSLFYPSEGAEERLDIILTEIEEESEFNGTNSGSVTLDGGIMLDYSEGAFLSSDGINYEGTVHMFSTFMEASLDDFALKAPGNFQAVNIENRLVGLSPQSLLQISFQDEAGNELLIDQDAEVSIQVPDVNPLLDAWYYVPNFGLYTINTVSTADGNGLRIGLSHNNYILLAESYESELSTIQLSAADGTGLLEDIQTECYAEDGTMLQSVRSNNQGLAKIISPINREGNLIIIDACGNEVYNESQSNIDSEISLAGVSLKTLEGDIYDCDVRPIEDGVVAVEQGNKIRYHYLNSSNFSLALQVCNNGEAEIQGLDGTTPNQNQLVDLNLINEDALGDLFTCDNPRINTLHLVNISTGEEYFYFLQPGDANTVSLTEFGWLNNSQGININIVFNGSMNGDYSDDEDHEIEALQDLDTGFNFSGDAESFIVSRFGSTDKLTIGNFEGIFEDVDRQVSEELQATFNFYFRE